MDTVFSDRTTPDLATSAAPLAIGAATAELLLLASLHVLSPEFDPAWRVISEYALGQYGWVLSLMFLAGALNAWALAAAVWPHVTDTAGKMGVGLLIVAGVGPAMASVFAIDHPLHDLAGMIGVLGLPVAAMLISTYGLSTSCLKPPGTGMQRPSPPVDPQNVWTLSPASAAHCTHPSRARRSRARPAPRVHPPPTPSETPSASSAQSSSSSPR